MGLPNWCQSGWVLGTPGAGVPCVRSGAYVMNE